MRLLILPALLACVMLPGCGGSGAPDTVDLALTQDDLGETFALRVGQTLSLTLPENPSTGHSWQRSWAPENLLALSYDLYEAPDTNAVGAPGSRHYVFQALRPGTVVITVQYGQWWEEGEQQEPQTLTLAIGA